MTAPSSAASSASRMVGRAPRWSGATKRVRGMASVVRPTRVCRTKGTAERQARVEPSWQPGNDLEHALMTAIEDGDPRRYARLVLDATFYVPVLPDPGTAERDEVTRQLGLTEHDILVFTSPAALGRFLGPVARGHVTATFAELTANVREEDEARFIIDPGLPITAVLPPAVVPELAEGRQATAPVSELRDVVRDEVRRLVPLLALAEFAGEAEPRTDLPPSNALENALAAALAERNEDAYMQALISGEVVVPTTGPVPVNDLPGIPPLPWQLAGTDEIPVITVFSSVAMLEAVAGKEQHHTTDLLFNVFARWPDERHVLCFNPGADTQLVLSGQAVLEITDLIAADLADS
ncbi:SseB family protein [Amycolatopsis thermoflava]|uniref:SseB family protein n=2 Tax=Pseudonocardiaceae TaxID=2070 RepID=UPI003D73CD77